MQSVEDGDGAAETKIAVEPVRDRQQDDRQQEEQIEQDDPAPRLGLPRQPPVMADPEHAGDDETEREAGEFAGIDMGEFTPARRGREDRGLGQVVGEQRHRDAEDGVAQRLEPPHLEQVGRERGHAVRLQAGTRELPPKS